MRFWILWVFAFSCVGRAASTKIPDKNPFYSTDVSALSQSIRSASALKLVFSGNVTGMRESCGCALSPKGGMERRYNFLKNEGFLENANADTLKLDFGNMLFKTPDYDKGDEKEALSNALAMVKGVNLFNLSAVNFGIMDRTLSPEKLSKIWEASKFSWVASNITPSDKLAAHFKRRIPLKLNVGEVMIFGLSSFDDKIKEYGWGFEKPAEALRKELAGLPAHVFPIVLSDVEMSELVPMASVVKRPILFLGARESGGWDRPLEVGQALLVHLRQQGQEWGVFRFSPSTAGKKGWFNPADTELLGRRWNDLVTEAHTVRGLATSNQKELELGSIETKIKELALMAPQPTDIAFSFETTEMNSSFDGANAATPFVK